MFASCRIEIAGMSPLREPRIRGGSCSLPRRKASGLACHGEKGEPGSRTIFPLASSRGASAGIRECGNTPTTRDRAHAVYMIDALSCSRLMPSVLARRVWDD